MHPSSLIFVVCLLVFCWVLERERNMAEVPKAKTIDHVWERQNGPFPDPYAWMTHKKPYPEDMLEYLKNENEYSNAWFSKHKELSNKLFEEIKAKTDENDVHLPYPGGEYYYTTRTEEDKQYEIHSRGKSEKEATSETILDENELALTYGKKEKDHFFALGLFEVSPNEKMLAYSIDIAGNEKFDLYFKNLESGSVSDEKLSNTYYDGAWSADSEYFFYLVQDDENRPYQLWRHKIGEEAKNDVKLFEESDKMYYLEVKLSRSQNWVIYSSHSLQTSEVWVINAADPLSKPILVRERKQGVEYRVDDWGSQFVILTNEDALGFKLVLADHKNPGIWNEFVKEEKGVRIIRLHCFEKFLAILDWSNGQQRIRIVHKNENYSQEIVSIKEEYEPHAISFYYNPLFSPPSLLLSYQSLSYPYSIHSYDFEKKNCVEKKKKNIIGVDFTKYASRRIWVKSGEVSVPLDLVYSKESIGKDPQASPNKVLMYGYGSYEYSCPPTFSTSRLSLLDRGFIYALAHIRGGGEMGREWYEDGKLLNKKNTFYDFIACGEHLIEEGYTNKDLLVIRGGSAGGLLVGACVTMRPDLFRAAVAEVPFVDVVTTMLDDTIPLTANEWEEWGNPKNKEYEKYMWEYSPYENTKSQHYPSLYITAGLNDMRVSVHEPAKWTAKLRVNAQNDQTTHPILMHTEMSAGHFGPSGRHEEWKDEAKTLTFVLVTFD